MTRVLALGVGPGPRNILVEHDDGSRVVYIYRKGKKYLAEKEYVTVAGFVQFDPKERDLDDGRQVRDVVIRAIGSQEQIRITLWDQFEEVEIDKGDFIVADGSVTTREVDGTVYYNVSASRIYLGSPVEAKERETTTSKSTRKTGKKAPF